MFSEKIIKTSSAEYKYWLACSSRLAEFLPASVMKNAVRQNQCPGRLYLSIEQ